MNILIMPRVREYVSDYRKPHMYAAQVWICHDESEALYWEAPQSLHTPDAVKAHRLASVKVDLARVQMMSQMRLPFDVRFPELAEPL